MLKASYTSPEGKRIAIVGLSTKDLRSLEEGGGFRVKLEELGMHGGDLVIMWGTNDRAIADELARQGIHVA